MSNLNKQNISIFFSGVFTLILLFLLASLLGNHLVTEDIAVGVIFWFLIYIVLFILSVIFVIGLISIIKNGNKNMVRTIYFLTGAGFSSSILNVLIHFTDIMGN